MRRCRILHRLQHVFLCTACDWQDMQQDGCSLATILRAGQWRSAAFSKYLDEADLEKACWHSLAFLGRPSACLPCAPQEVILELGVDSDNEEWID